MSGFRGGTRFVLAGFLFFSACGGGKAQNPSGPTTPATVAPTPTAPPSAPTDPRITKSCAKLKAGSKSAVCQRETPRLLVDVNDAIAQYIQQHAENFNGYSILNPGAYIVGVMNELDAKGICALWDGAELAVKSDDTFNEQFEVITSKQQYRSGNNIYMSTCTPAAFPLGLPGLAPTAGCSLAPSRELYCAKNAVSLYVGVVDDAIGEVLQTHPEFFDFTDTAPLTNFPKIVNADGYIKGVEAALTKKGLCSYYDGEELQVKGSNEQSEHFDIVLQSMHIRRGGTYESSCYPAAF